MMLAGLLVFGAMTARGQEAAAAPSADPQQPSAAPGGYTLRTGADLVVLDVVVTGADGRPVLNLKKSDFAVDENGAPQSVRYFAGHTAADSHANTAVPAPAKLPPGLFTNYAAGSQSGAANVILLDMLNTPLRDQNYARQQIRDFLNRAPSGTQVAIFGLSNRLTILQGFTSDPRILRAALAGKSAGAASSLLDDPLGGGGGDGAGATAVSDAFADLETTPETLEAVANAQQFEAQTDTFRLQLRSSLTLDALNELARYLSNIAGRKNLIWFSGSFPVSVLPSTTTDNGFASMGSSEKEFRETMALLARGQVALYPVDARGLLTSGTYSAAASNSKFVRDPAAAGKAEANFDAEIAGENETMLQAAHDTGGRAFVNTNGLLDAVKQAIDEGSNYYTLTYSPTDKQKDGRFRKIEVTLPGKPYTLSYRRGYYSDSPAASEPAPAGSNGGEALAANSLITRSMVRGAPVPTQIQFTVRVVPATGAAEKTVVPGNELATASGDAKPPFTRYAVDFAINPRDFAFAQSGGEFHDTIEFVAFVYDGSGTLVNRAGTTLHADFKSTVYTSFVSRPFSYNEDISVPRSGSYFLRLAVHDLNNDHIGAVEIPVDSVKSLPPLASAPPASGAKH